MIAREKYISRAQTIRSRESTAVATGRASNSRCDRRPVEWHAGRNALAMLLGDKALLVYQQSRQSPIVDNSRGDRLSSAQPVFTALATQSSIITTIAAAIVSDCSEPVYTLPYLQAPLLSYLLLFSRASYSTSVRVPSHRRPARGREKTPPPALVLPRS